jgi:hypothetical protein
VESRAGSDDARGGRGRFFLIIGEPGIGKTPLANEVSIDAASAGMNLLRAGCRGSGDSGFAGRLFRCFARRGAVRSGTLYSSR